MWAKFWTCRRQNPGGTSPLIDGKLLGFAGIIDISTALTSDTKVGEIKVKAGTGPVQKGNANFSAASPAALTPTAAATVLNALAFNGVTFGVDTATGRLMAQASDISVKYIQIYSELAGALNFGDCRYKRGYGSYFYNGFTGDLKSATPTENWNEDTTVENDNGWGDKIVYTSPGNRGTAQISIVDRRLSIEMKQMVDGGTWIPGTATEPEQYNPPGPDDDPNERRIDVHVFTHLFSNKQNTSGSQTHVEEKIYIGCVGHSTEAGGAGSWTDGQYDLTAASYKDLDGVEQNSPRSNFYTRSQWEALNMQHGIVVDNWAEA
ncbi:MAG: hypothetical protein LBC27_09730 [Spirochaetaceae bacterium]|jgi:hypothetical protein|nr:hypothetical protein [Spirochaetaceae bacterium]